MKTKKPVLRPLALVASALLSCALNLPAQTAPTITTQPANLTVVAGSNATFAVAVAGTGPFTYQWRFNGNNLPNNIISTLAGNGSGGYSGDGGAAINANLNQPNGVVLDAAGNLYIADCYNSRIRKVDTNGIITTVAGTNGAGYSGDGGMATNAMLSDACGVALDTTGNLFIADYSNNRIRKVDTSGIITTVAGTNGAGYSGDGGMATNAMLNYPCGVALDGFGNVYIGDFYNNRIRKVNTSGIITTVAGSGPINPGGGYSGDGGPATSAGLWLPHGVALDALGDLYIADSYNNRIRKVDTSGIISTVTGNGSPWYTGDGGEATNATFDRPCCVALDALGNLYFDDLYHHRIRMVNTNNIINTVAGNGFGGFSGDGGPATNALLDYPYGVSLDAAGNLYIADSANNRIREIHFAGLPTLALTNVGASNAGSYSVVITSPYGSVTSAVAALTVTIPSTPPQIIVGDGSFGFLTNQFGFDLSGVFGQTLVVDGSTDLVNWMPLFTNTVGGSPFYFYDPGWTNFAWRFYRARLQ